MACCKDVAMDSEEQFVFMEVQEQDTIKMLVCIDFQTDEADLGYSSDQDIEMSIPDYEPSSWTFDSPWLTLTQNTNFFASHLLV